MLKQIGMNNFKPGDKAPQFSGKNQKGETVSLDQFKGKKLILYFYPKDNTPGCTAESCSLRDGYELLIDKGFEVVGVSPDNEKSHQNFISKYELPFNLIADTEKEILKAYGAWGMKKMYGKDYEGVLRTTFIINEKGLIEAVISKVNTKEHVDQILEEMGEVRA
jgi:peroxiredoxin Q/BCP